MFWTDIKTQPKNQLANGASTFMGYKHQMSLKFTTLRPDGTWTAPQAVALPVDTHFGPSSGQITDPLSGVTAGVAQYDSRFRWGTEAIDDYTLSGPNWDWVWPTPSSSPASLEIQFRNFMEQLRRRPVRTEDDRTSEPRPREPLRAPLPAPVCAEQRAGEGRRRPGGGQSLRYRQERGERHCHDVE